MYVASSPFELNVKTKMYDKQFLFDRKIKTKASFCHEKAEMGNDCQTRRLSNHVL